MHLVPIAVLALLFFFWTAMLVLVYREFRDAPKVDVAMTLTFYTLGIAGALLLLGSRGKDTVLGEWVGQITGEVSEPADSVTEGLTWGGEDISAVLKKHGGRLLHPELEQTVREGAKYILQEAIKERATDVHLEPGPDLLRVRYRVDGVLQTRGAQPPEMASPISAVLKVLADMDVAERRRPQEGSFTATMGGRPIDFRVSTAGTPYGEKMVIRILDRRVGLRRLQDLGLRQSMYNQMHSIVNRKHGMLVVCGPTGSGKTTTLYAALQEVDRESLNVLTIENPIEYSLENVTQQNVNEKAGITFARLLRTALHQDPDIIMVGEMRDSETAQIAMQAALTGHFVYTTVHSPDTVSALFRLLSLGVEPYAVVSSVTAILAQRLTRRLCKACQEGHKPTAEEMKLFGLSAEKVKVLYTAKGCQKCHGTGCWDRIAAFELLVLDDEIRSLVQAGASLVEIKKAAHRTGTVPLRIDALAKAATGIASVQEAIRATS